MYFMKGGEKVFSLVEISTFKENSRMIEVGKILKSVVPRHQYMSIKKENFFAMNKVEDCLFFSLL